MKTMLRTGPIIIIACSLCLFTLPTQAQETDAQKMLMDSIKYDKLDIAGVKAALDKGANPNWVPDTARGDSVLGRLAYAALSAKDKRAEEKGVEILQVLFRAGAKLQPRDQKILVFPICGGWALFTEVLLKNGANATREIDGETPMEMAASWGQAKIIELLRKYGVPALENRVAAQLRFISAAGRLDISVMEEAIRNGAYVNAKNRWGKTALVNAFYMALGFCRRYPKLT